MIAGDDVARRLKVLIAAEGHPELSWADGDIAAFGLFQALKAQETVKAWFLGAVPEAQALGVELTNRICQPFEDDTFLYGFGDVDPFTFANRDPLFVRAFSDLLRRLEPDVIHVHGLKGFGVEVFGIARRVLPQARLLVTLRDYGPICANRGRMVRVTDRGLCPRASLEGCSACFPDEGEAALFARAHYIRLCLSKADHAIAPTEFLRTRYVEWGVSPEDIFHIPAVTVAPESPAEPRTPDGTLRVGYFAGRSAIDGIEVLLAAARRLEAAGDRTVAFVVHGAGEEGASLREDDALALLMGAPSNVEFVSVSAGQDLSAHMAGLDVVACPDLWPDGGLPIVDLALRNSRPVAVSALGAAEEVVRPGVDGWLLPPGDDAALAGLLARVAAAPYLLGELSPASRSDDAMLKHLHLYRRLTA